MCVSHWIGRKDGHESRPVEPVHSPVHSDVSNSGQTAGRMVFESDVFQKYYDIEPFDLTHNLGSLDLFTTDSLTALADKFASAPKDFYVAESAPTPDTAFSTFWEYSTSGT
jgi:hypothetical protein